MAKLKPCPFCGGEAEYISFVDDNVQAIIRKPACQIRCMNCKVIMGDFVAEDYSFSYKDKATEAWNRRAEDGK